LRCNVRQGLEIQKFMPLLPDRFPGSPIWLPEGHSQTIWPAVFRKVTFPKYFREVFQTRDNDQIFLDWQWQTERSHSKIKLDSDRGEDIKPLAILLHGLEGDSNAQYMLGTGKILHEAGFDILAMNCRSCGGEMNKTIRMYNHSDFDDLEETVAHAIECGYHKIFLVGFSMGGTIILNYLLKSKTKIPKELIGTAVVSTPLDLYKAVNQLNNLNNIIYRIRFQVLLQRKTKYKAKQFPGVLPIGKLRKFTTWEQYDKDFTTIIGNFQDEKDFYEKATVVSHLENLKIPTFMLQAKNDSILTPNCFPSEIARCNPNLFLEITKKGGHCGYTTSRKNYPYSEIRIQEFFLELLSK
jgi:uncharacterized protein